MNSTSKSGGDVGTAAGHTSTVTEHTLTALYFIHKYRYLTVSQVARITGLREKTASEILLRLERQKLLDHFGNTGVRGYGKTPKVYFLKKRAHTMLLEELELPESELGTFKETHVSSRWSPQMYHRIATLDVLIAAEADCAETTSHAMTATFLENRRERIGGQWRSETTDLVAEEEIPENTIVPDAGFVVENVGTGKRGLFLIEMDMGTERLVSKLRHGKRLSFRHKIMQYDRYLMSGRFVQKYKPHGEFDHFVMLTITTSVGRMDNMRRELSDLPGQLHQYYRFNTLDTVCDRFFNDAWRGRLIADETQYQLIQTKGGNQNETANQA